MYPSTLDVSSVPDNCPWGIAAFDYQSGEIVKANHYMRSIFRVEVKQEISDRFMLSERERLDEVVHAIDPGAQWVGRIYPRSSYRGISSVEVLFERSASEPDLVWLFLLEHPLLKDEVRFSRRSELRILNVLLDNTLEYVFFRDLDGKFIIANEAFRHAVAHDGQVPGMNNAIEDFASPESATWLATLDAQMMESGRPIVNEVALFLFKNKMEHWLQLTIVPVRSSDGVIIGSLSVARDISDLKRTESDLRAAIADAREASRAKGDFLAAMSHEIRTPINGIIGASELCRETSLDIEQRGYLDTVIQCGSTLLSLVNDVLDFSRIEAGRLNIEKLNFSPRVLIESVAGEFSQAARSSGVEIVVGFDSMLPEFVMGDPTRVKQLLYNLVGNAMKFTDKGEVVIRADVISRDAEEIRILFSVNDSGIGISRDRQDAIFNSFTQADMSTTRKYGGSGLGLSICKELVRLMDGTIRVESELGAGARFEFEISFPVSVSSSEPSVPFNAELAGMRVLIVDDNQINCELYRQMCQGWGYRCVLAEDGVSGLTAMEAAVRDRDPFRLIILDQQLPGLTGLDLASLMQARPDLRNTQIVLLSSSLNKDESERAASMGVARALAKPVKRAILHEVILETFEVGGIELAERGAVPTNIDPSKAPLQVLLVEDHPINQDLARRRLQKLGHEVTLAEDGAEAVDKVKVASFDCILMDIQMPRLDGFEATKAIRELEVLEERPRHFIIAMTAHVMKGDKERCLNAGMDDYISKPFRADVLKQVLELARMSVQKASLASESAGDEPTSFATRFDRLNDEDREDILLAAPIFLQAAPEDILRLRNAVADKDFKDAYLIGHTLKGVAGIFGCRRCMAAAIQVEAACDAEDVVLLGQQADVLIEAIEALAKEIEFAGI